MMMNRSLQIRLLDEACRLETLLDHDVLHRIKHSANVSSVGSARDMGVDSLLPVAILGLELLLHVFGCSLEIITTGVVWEILNQRYSCDLVSEQVTLVEEQNHGCVTEPSTVANLIEQLESLNHSVSLVILVQQLIVFADGGNKK